MAPNYSYPRLDSVRERLAGYTIGENDTAPYQVQKTTPTKIPFLETHIDDTWEGSHHISTTDHDLTSKNSRTSLASTSRRSSAAPSIFSTAGLRVSTASTVYSRYSIRQQSLDSADPTSSITPWSSEKCDERFNTDDSSPRYYCTFCDAIFGCPVQWRDHELKDHDRPEEYQCSICHDSFPERPSLAAHCRVVHGLSSPSTAEHIVKLATRGAWGCGFCGAFAQLRPDYLDHIGRHCEEGMQRVHWQHSSVIRGLLKQPKILEAWNCLVANQERERGTKLHFAWDEHTTGRHADIKVVDAHNPSRLQDILEFFATSSSDPHTVAQYAFDMAQIRTEQNVSILVKAYYSHGLRPLPESPDDIGSPLIDEKDRLHLGAENDGKHSDISVPYNTSPLPVSSTAEAFTTAFPLQTPGMASELFVDWDYHTHAQSKASQSQEADIAPERKSTPNTTENASFLVAKATEYSHLKSTAPPVVKGLRRIDSDRYLDALNSGGADLARGEPIQRPRTTLASEHTKSLVSAERDVKAIQNPSLSDALLELAPRNNVVRKDWLLVPKPGSRSSLDSPSVSSLHSGNTRNRYLTLDDSTSERISEDSLSDPDVWAEHDISHDHTGAWSKAYQRAINSVIQRLWSQYNQNWDALIRSCVGSVGSTNTERMDPYRAGKATPSRRRPGGSLRPPSSRRTPDDDDDDDDDDGSQPSPYASRPGSAMSKRFACPFRKHNPEKYNRVDYDICANKDWPTIPRLKEHLYRRHYKIHCQRCKQTFSDARQLTIHEMAPEACELLDIKPPGDITTSQERQLKSRKHTHRRQSDEEKWREIYRLLFPNHIVPSPYPEYAEDFQPMGAESRNVLEFQHYLLTEMPRLFTQAAYEYAGQHIQDQVVLRIDDVNKIIEDTLQQAYDAWTLQGRLLPLNISPSISMREFSAAPATQPGPSTSMPTTTWSETHMPPPPYMTGQTAPSFMPNTSAPEYTLFPAGSEIDVMLSSLDDLEIPSSNPVGSAPTYTSNGYMTTGPDVQYTGAGFFPYGGNTGENQNWF
ncbi:hypothetical protein B0T20DRAFT_98842 [Sordaria brevicollis]|uniref:C2H2-type domain-containing protein n=1 Tax=Sordaria brevicollis TaxID=83679 RepID=A0AAE0NW16_SORBR|nr:hypothetical protein B0T20DRAFT_98842 [Sordaria brevicollis]